MGDVIPLLIPFTYASHATRLELLRAYRDGLRRGPGEAWPAALALARERFPHLCDRDLQKCLLLTLGLWSVELDAQGKPLPDREEGLPCLIPGHLYLRLSTVARSYGLSLDELAGRIVVAWLAAACDFDGVVQEPVPPVPPADAGP